jgi:hypothetical protein
MNLPVILFLLVLLLALWLYIRRRSRSEAVRKSVPPPEIRKEDTAFHAVSIRYSSNACNAAREMEGRRFLSSTAPRLPLPDCDVSECNCRFIHHKDRRSGRDRRSPFPATGFGGGSGVFEKERREGRDRRSRRSEDRF